jgi:hypothetical protein
MRSKELLDRYRRGGSVRKECPLVRALVGLSPIAASD